MDRIYSVLIGTGFTFLATILGASMVLFFKRDLGGQMQKAFLGFAAGVMIAASIWSLLVPAMEQAQSQGINEWIPAAGGFLLGVGFLMVLDSIIPHFHIDSEKPEGLPSSLKRTTMLIFAVTLHNIPEGMAVGLAFAMAQEGSVESITTASAITLAIGMAIQNFPEGAAISLPLRREGMSRAKAFVYGSLSGIVEPIAGVIAVLIAGTVYSILPWFLSFAAGAMMYVVVEELIPEAHLGEHSHLGTLSVMLGFLVMMVLDVALG